MEGPTCNFVEGPGWELASTGYGSSESLALAAAGSTRTAASSSTGRTKWACRKQLAITAGSCCKKRHIVMAVVAFKVLLMSAIGSMFPLAVIAMVKTPNNTVNSTDCPINININVTVEDSGGNENGEFDWDELTQSYIFAVGGVGTLMSMLIGARLCELYGVKFVVGISMVITAVLTLLSPSAARLSVWLFIMINFTRGVFSSSFVSALPHLANLASNVLCSTLSHWLRMKGFISQLTAYRIFNFFATIGTAVAMIVVAQLGCNAEATVSVLVLTMTLNGAYFGGSFMNLLDLEQKDGKALLAPLCTLALILFHSKSVIWHEVVEHPQLFSVVYILRMIAPNHTLEHLVFYTQPQGKFIDLLLHHQSVYWHVLRSMLAEPLQHSLLQIRVRRTLQIIGLYIVAFLLHYIHNLFSHFENREKCRLRNAMPPRNLHLCNLLLIHFLDYLLLLHERQEGPLFTHFQTRSSWGNVFYVSAAVSTLPFFIFLFLGSVEEQPWNIIHKEEDEEAIAEVGPEDETNTYDSEH
uniref:Uncharacterized protein n=1 Tax=Timema bartmani TaxID=61472 RepID=A0A7R9EZP0_9NEOP|nr:unnamed protein product [Timema bartmani]